MGDQHMLVLWPEPDDPDWRDTKQGGLFAYLVYREVGPPDRAEIDVFAHLSSPGLALPKALASQLWAPPHVTQPRGAPRSLAPWSKPLRAAVYLGSCPWTPVGRRGAPFQVCRTDLTKTGDAIAHALDYELGYAGDILTFVSPAMKRRRWTWADA